jgi:hypothetical protein
MAGPNACGSETSLFNGIARRLRALKHNLSRGLREFNVIYPVSDEQIDPPDWQGAEPREPPAIREARSGTRKAGRRIWLASATS